VLFGIPVMFVRMTGHSGWGTHVSDWVWLNSVLMLPASLLLLVLHQGARAIVGTRLGIRSGIQIGAGRRLVTIRGGSAPIVLHWFPCGAFVLDGATETRSLRLRMWLMCLSGTLSMAALGGTAWYVGGASWDAVGESVMTRAAPAAVLVLGAIFVLAVTSDVYRLFTIPLAPASRLSSVLLWGHLFQAGDRAERQDHAGAAEAARHALAYVPDDPIAQRIHVATRQAVGEPVLDLAKALIEKPSPVPSLRCQAANLWAWGCYLSQDPDLLAAADEASSEALFLARNDPASRTLEPGVLDTRGHVLLWAERYDEAADALTRANTLATNEGTRCASACGLAMVHAGCGRLPEAERWLAMARDLEPTHHLIARAEARVDAARASGPT